jgi:ATP-dependent DNA ligase
MMVIRERDRVRLQLSMRKATLARLLSHRIERHLIAEYERGDLGGDLFRGACNVNLKGIISKQSDRVYGPSKCKH